jgi:hypothetical protein
LTENNRKVEDIRQQYMNIFKKEFSSDEEDVDEEAESPSLPS